MQDAIPDDLVRHELHIVCASAEFARSPRHQRLLRYLVEELLAERLANLREIHLGVHVFGRSPADFDPATDTIVRVEARRLRARLQRYYATPDAGRRIAIELPLGSYIPALHWLAADPIRRSEGATLPVVAVLPFDALKILPRKAVKYSGFGSIPCRHAGRFITAGAIPPPLSRMRMRPPRIRSHRHGPTRRSRRRHPGNRPPAVAALRTLRH